MDGQLHPLNASVRLTPSSAAPNRVCVWPVQLVGPQLLRPTSVGSPGWNNPTSGVAGWATATGFCPCVQSLSPRFPPLTTQKPSPLGCGHAGFDVAVDGVARRQTQSVTL